MTALRKYPLIRVSLKDRFYCMEGVPSSECPLKTCFTVFSCHKKKPFKINLTDI